MTGLTKNIRTHIVILSDGRELQITYEQYQNLKMKLDDSKYSDPLVIKDCDTNQVLFDGKVGAIKEFKHKEQSSSYMDERRWICEWGVRHRIDGFLKNCTCEKRSGFTYIKFHEKLREHGYKFTSPSEIKREWIDKMKDFYGVNV